MSFCELKVYSEPSRAQPASLHLLPLILTCSISSAHVKWFPDQQSVFHAMEDN